MKFVVSAMRLSMQPVETVVEATSMAAARTKAQEQSELLVWDVIGRAMPFAHHITGKPIVVNNARHAPEGSPVYLSAEERSILVDLLRATKMEPHVPRLLASLQS